ncbi:transglycosylase SLT domain-containing protein [Dyella sp. S184]|uniref:transglycosylase SLT domain-containing protein n=1 Tax=Dyella sp. S184 TaxID=1641862 RepID=UPI0020B15334|nr:transglycosylase SLT domain-containing protein [Dyella sp. S184]
MLTAISLCAVFGVAAIPVAMGVAYSQWQPGKPSIARARGAWQAPSSRNTIAPVAVLAPTSRLTTPASSASPPEPLAVEPKQTNPQAALLSDVSTMDLTMPIAEPDLDIASQQSLWAQVGKESGVDPLLLYSVALVESRSLLPGGKVGPTPWLFRVNDHLVLGERHHVQLEMATASQLGSAVQDVGIMQVYYPMHRDAVRDPLTLLDPRTNISVAAKILHDGMHETRDPVLGVGYYHSHTPQLAKDYGTAVLTVYQRLKILYHPGKARQAIAR